MINFTYTHSSYNTKLAEIKFEDKVLYVFKFEDKFYITPEKEFKPEMLKGKDCYQEECIVADKKTSEDYYLHGIPLLLNLVDIWKYLDTCGGEDGFVISYHHDRIIFAGFSTQHQYYVHRHADKYYLTCGYEWIRDTDCYRKTEYVKNDEEEVEFEVIAQPIANLLIDLNKELEIILETLEKFKEQK